MTLAEFVGDKVRAAREAKGWTQVGLAQLMDRDAAWITKIENGHQVPTLQSALALANVLGVTVDHLVGRVL